MESIKTIEYEGSQLAYVKNGKGKRVMITVHGFGQSTKDFELIEAAYPGYTFYHISLFFHQSYLHPSHRPLSTEVWLNIFDELLLQEKIENFSLAGFSIGCRFIYSVSERHANYVREILLLAPEGENFSAWYRAGTSIFKRFFKCFIFRPCDFYLLLKFLVKLKLLNSSVARFARSQMKSRNKRWQVYMTWMNFRWLRLNLKKWSEIITKNRIPVTVASGKNDVLIPGKSAIAIQKATNARHFKIKAGHYDLIKKSVEFLKQSQ